MPLSPGTKIGTYEIQAPLGEGGMGAVYQAHDPTLQRTVAIKVLAKQDADASARLLQEARAASALNHPHICTIHEVGEHEGQAFIVMEHVEGKPLSALIPADGLPPESVIRYGTQIADALAHAHERGIVHRDLKSANVVITPDGRAKVLDFGLAARMPSADAEAVTKTQDAIPHAGMLVGTLAYMAPEVLRGESATARSDIWALGVLLYEMASGRLPFGGNTAADVASATLKETPATLPSRVSAGLRSIIHKCLAKESGQRYTSAAVVQGALEAIQSDTGVTQPAGIASVGAMRTWRVAAAVIGLVLVAGVIGYLRQSRRETMSTLPHMTNPIPVTTAAVVEDFPALSPDGEMLTYQSMQTGNWDIWVTQIDQRQPINRTADHPGDDRLPTWSPDGRQIAFLSDRDGGGVFVMPILGGIPRKVASMPNTTSAPQWSSDGTRVAILETGEGEAWVEIVSLQSDGSQRLPAPGTTHRVRMDLSWSRDSQFFAYVEGDHNYEGTRVWVLRVVDGDAFPITDGRTRDHSPSWSADGRTLYFVSNRGGSQDVWQQRLQDDGRPDGPAQRVTAGIGIRHMALSADGSRLVYAKGGRFVNVWRVPLLHDRLAIWDDAEQITSDQASLIWFDVSPDGEWLAVSSDRRGNQDIWVLPAAGGAPRQLTTDPSIDLGPAWSPDGQLIAFWAYRGGSHDIWVVPAAGGPERQVTQSDTTNWMPAWSPDGQEIAFSKSPGQGIWLVPAEGGDARQLTLAGERPVWSPDGGWVAYYKERDIWRVRAASGEESLVAPGGGRTSRWSTDADTLYFTRSGDLWAASVDDDTEQRLTDLKGMRGTLGSVFDIGGAYLYFTWRENLGDIWVMDVVQDDGSND